MVSSNKCDRPCLAHCLTVRQQSCSQAKKQRRKKVRWTLISFLILQLNSQPKLSSKIFQIFTCWNAQFTLFTWHNADFLNSLLHCLFILGDNWRQYLSHIWGRRFEIDAFSDTDLQSTLINENIWAIMLLTIIAYTPLKKNTQRGCSNTGTFSFLCRRHWDKLVLIRHNWTYGGA